MAITAVTSKLLALEAPARWAEQYRGHVGDNKAEITRKLSDLDNPTPAKVEEIIGNNSWTRINCDACNKEVTRVVRIGHEWSDHATDLCLPCLKKSIRVLELAR